MVDNLTIGKLAEAAGVGIETIRYYQRQGLLRKPARPYGRVRRYAAADLARLQFIRTAQWLGFSLKEVAELLRLDEGDHCAEVSRLAERKLAEVQTKRAHLERLETMLLTLLRDCRKNRRPGCPLISSLHDGLS